MAVKSKEMKRFRRLDTINKEYTEENIRKGFERYQWGYESPSVQAPNTKYMLKPRNDYQERYYLQIVHFAYMEKFRFNYQNKHQSEVKKMHETHERYLYLVKHGINGIEGILKESEAIDRKLLDLSSRQKKLYKERADKKRKCKTEEDVCEFALWEENYHKELEKIKEKKKELLHQKKLGKQCIVESIVHFDTIGEYTDEYMRLCDVAKKQSGYRKEYYHERGERRR